MVLWRPVCVMSECTEICLLRDTPLSLAIKVETYACFKAFEHCHGLRFSYNSQNILANFCIRIFLCFRAKIIYMTSNEKVSLLMCRVFP